MYNNSWNKIYPWINSVPRDNFSAYCTLCKKSFSVSARGESAVKDHAKTELHQKNERSAEVSRKVTSFFTRE